MVSYVGFTYANEVSTALDRLAANIAAAAALCRAWQLGVHINGAGWWYPGRGDEAPAFEGPTALDEDNCGTEVSR